MTSHHPPSSRLEALGRYAVIDTPREPAFDAIARHGATVCGTPIGLVSFLTEDRQWFKAELGLGVDETPISWSFCRHALERGDLWVVPDATLEPAVADSPLVTGEQSLRAYAGAVIRAADGTPIGTVCAIDRLPREFDEAQRQTLKFLARHAEGLLEARAAVEREVRAERHAHEERLARMNRLYRVLSRVNEAIVRNSYLGGLYRAVSQIATDEGGFVMAAVVEVDPSSGVVRPVAISGSDDGYFEEKRVVLGDELRNVGTIGTSLRTGRYDYCNDIARDPRFSLWRSAAERRGYRATGSFPIRTHGLVTGALVLCAREANYFQADELELLGAVSDDLSFATEAIRGAEQRVEAQLELARTRRQYELVLEAVGEGIHGIDQSGRITFENRAALAMIGPHAGSMLGQNAHALLHHHHADGRPYLPEHCPILATLRDGQVRHIDHEVFFRADGSSFPVAYTASPVTDESGAIASVVVSFRDITDRQSRARLDALENELLAATSEDRELDHLFAIIVRGIESLIEGAEADVARPDPSRRRLVSTRPVSTVGHDADVARPAIFPSTWSFPVAGSADAPQAVIALRFRQARHPTESELESIQRIVSILGLALDRERKKRELRASDELRRIAGRAAKMGGWTVSVPDYEITWSDEVCLLHGEPPGTSPTLERAIGYYAPEYRPIIAEAFGRCLDAGVPFDLRCRIITAGGALLDVRAIGEALRDAEGRITAVQGAFQDISEMRAAEESLAASELRFRQLAESMPMMVFTATPEGEVDYSNGLFYAFTGVAHRSLGDTSFVTGVHPADAAPTEAAWREAVAAGVPFEREVRLVAKSGEARWHRVKAVPTRDAEGRVIKWYGTRADVHDAKRLEADALALARRLETTLESITDAFVVLDREWRISFVNGEAARLIGESRETLLGQDLWHMMSSDNGTLVKARFMVARETGETVNFEFLGARSGRWMDVTAYPSSEGLAVHFRDVTEQRRIREAMRISDERFMLLSRATNDVIWDWDVERGTLWWNEAFETTFGFRRDAVGSSLRSWTENIHPEDRIGVLADLETALSEGRESWTREYRFVHASGRPIYVVDRGFILRDEHGKPIRMIGSMVDISERRATEERLREQATLLDKAQDAILVRDLHDRVLFWNKSCERIYGWTAEEAVGQPVKSLLYGNPHDFVDATQQVLATGEWTGELEQLTKSGKRIMVVGRWTLVRAADGTPKSILAINTDVTDKKRLEQQFLRAQRLESIGTLAGGIAHDLNNMLAPILMTTSSMLSDELDEERRQDLEVVERAARRGAAMVRQLLVFARGHDGTRALLKVGDIVGEVYRMMRDTFPKSIGIRLDVDEHAWEIVGDPTQIHQLLTNLCVNARDAMPDGGVLTIAVETCVLDEVYAEMNIDAKPGTYVLLRVEDTGTGIAPTALDRIFEPFFTTKEVGRGTGLGLSTVHAIVRSHGGFINVYSEVGKGARFKVYLPAELPADVRERVTMEQSGIPRGDGETILVVDDEEAIRKVASRTLERYGYRVMLASNGAEAVALYAKHGDSIDLVLTDMAMPVMDGPATIVAITSINPKARIVGSSGLNANGNIAKAVDAGVRHFVPKPYTAEAMMRVIKRALVEGPTTGGEARPILPRKMPE